MKRKLKAFLITGLLSIMLTGQVASAATYYARNEEEDIIQYNRGLATNEDFTIIYENDDIEFIDWFEEEYSLQDYANSSYANYNYKYANYEKVEVPEDDKVRIKVDFTWWGYETAEETEYVYNFIRELIRNNPSIIKASDYDKAAWAYNWVCSNVKYDPTLKNHSAYKGLTEYTVCSGYAKYSTY